MVTEKIYDARVIANYFLDLAKSHGRSLSITAILKLFYFAHGWRLAEQGVPLIGQKFEAWQHGPVVRIIHEEFKEYSGGPIKKRATRFSIEQKEYVLAKDEIHDKVCELLDSVFHAYGSYHPFKLSDMTHEKDSPWEQIWKKGEKGLSPGMKIPNQSIKEYFLTRNIGDTFNA